MGFCVRWPGLTGRCWVGGGVEPLFAGLQRDKFMVFFTPWPAAFRSLRWPVQRACRVDARSSRVPDTALSGVEKNSSRGGRDVPHTPHRGLGFLDGFDHFLLRSFGQRLERSAFSRDLPVDLPVQRHDLRSLLHPGVDPHPHGLASPARAGVRRSG
jgi:hypothetical protein